MNSETADAEPIQAPPPYPPADCGSDDDTDHGDPHSPNHLWVEVKKVRNLHPNGYVVFDRGFAGFKLDYNGLLCPTDRVKGIECPKVVAKGAKNFWPIAWAKAHPVNLHESRVLVTVNSMEGRTQDQLHFHLTVLKTDIRAQLEKIDPSNARIDSWNKNLYILTTTNSETHNDDTYVYRIAHVDNLTDTDPFTLLNNQIALQKDPAKGTRYEDRFAQSLAIVKGPKGAGFFLIATQGQPQKSRQPPQLVHQPDLDLRGPTGHYYGTQTVEALIDREWKPL